MRELSAFEKLHVRVAVKAATPEAFTRLTGAAGETVELPFRGIEHLKEHGVSFHAAAMTDGRFLNAEERRAIFERLSKINPVLAGEVEEEEVAPYPMTVKRLKLARMQW